MRVDAVAMARPGRPASESFQPVSYSGNRSISFSVEGGPAGLADEVDRAPIFSLSKSSMDVVMATGPPHKRDPAWTSIDLRRSSSTNTHSEPNSVTLNTQLHPHNMWQHTNSHQLSQSVDAQSPPALSERWMTNMQRWSQCSGGTHSRSSTPDTVIWKERTSRPASLTQELLSSAAPDSPMSKPASPLTRPSAFLSPLQTPTLPPEELLAPSASPLRRSAHLRKDMLVSLPTSSSRLSAQTSSPTPTNSPHGLQLASTEDEGFLENSSLCFTFPSPLPSSVSLAEGGESHPGRPTDEPHSPGASSLSEGGGVRSPVQMLRCLTPNSPAKRQESAAASVCHLGLPWQPERRRSPLISSASDSQLGECCRCKGVRKVLRDEGTITSRPELVDAAVQTISPAGSSWGLRRNVSNSNMDSHSILGSPPGSRLNLKSSVGSHSNLVSPSSSMFPVSSGEEEEKRGDEQTWISGQDLDRRRSCLKSQGEDKDEMGRRSSMKQVQWDEDGMTWDIHGASVDPEVLTTAIQKHLEVQTSPQEAKPSSTKKKAPKPPPKSNVVQTKSPELTPTNVTASTCSVEGGSGTPGGAREAKEEEGGKKEEAARRVSRAEADDVKEDSEVYGQEGHPQSPSRGSVHSRKRSVIRLRRPGWCGGSRKEQE